MDILATSAPCFCYGILVSRLFQRHSKRPSRSDESGEQTDEEPCSAVVAQLRHPFSQQSFALRAMMLHCTLYQVSNIKFDTSGPKFSMRIAAVQAASATVCSFVSLAGFLWPLVHEVTYCQYHSLFHDLSLITSLLIHIFNATEPTPQNVPFLELVLYGMLTVVHQGIFQVAAVQLCFINLSHAIFVIGNRILNPGLEYGKHNMMMHGMQGMIVVMLLVLHRMQPWGAREQLVSVGNSVKPPWAALRESMSIHVRLVCQQIQLVCSMVGINVITPNGSSSNAKYGLPAFFVRALLFHGIVGTAALLYAGQTWAAVRAGQYTWAQKWPSVVAPVMWAIMFISTAACSITMPEWYLSRKCQVHMLLCGSMSSLMVWELWAQGPSLNDPAAVIFSNMLGFVGAFCNADPANKQAWRMLALKFGVQSVAYHAVNLKWGWWEGQPGWSFVDLLCWQVTGAVMLLLLHRNISCWTSIFATKPSSSGKTAHVDSRVEAGYTSSWTTITAAPLPSSTLRLVIPTYGKWKIADAPTCCNATNHYHDAVSSCTNTTSCMEDAYSSTGSHAFGVLPECLQDALFEEFPDPISVSSKPIKAPDTHELCTAWLSHHAEQSKLPQQANTRGDHCPQAELCTQDAGKPNAAGEARGLTKPTSDAAQRAAFTLTSTDPCSQHQCTCCPIQNVWKAIEKWLLQLWEWVMQQLQPLVDGVHKHKKLPLHPQVEVTLWSNQTICNRAFITVLLLHHTWLFRLVLAQMGLTCQTTLLCCMNLFASCFITMILLQTVGYLLNALPSTSDQTKVLVAKAALLYLPGTVLCLLNFHTPELVMIDLAAVATIAAAVSMPLKWHVLLHISCLLQPLASNAMQHKYLPSPIHICYLSCSYSAYLLVYVFQLVAAKRSVAHALRMQAEKERMYSVSGNLSRKASCLQTNTSDVSSFVTEPVTATSTIQQLARYASGNGSTQEAVDMSLKQQSHGTGTASRQSLSRTLSMPGSQVKREIVRNSWNASGVSPWWTPSSTTGLSPIPSVSRLAQQPGEVDVAFKQYLDVLSPHSPTSRDSLRSYVPNATAARWVHASTLLPCLQLVLLYGWQLLPGLIKQDFEVQDAEDHKPRPLFILLCSYASQHMLLLSLVVLMGLVALLLPPLLTNIRAQYQRFSHLAWYNQQHALLATASFDAVLAAEHAATLDLVLRPVLDMAQAVLSAHSVYIVVEGLDGGALSGDLAPHADWRDSAGSIAMVDVWTVCESSNLAFTGQEAIQQLLSLEPVLSQLDQCVFSGSGQVMDFDFNLLTGWLRRSSCGVQIHTIHSALASMWDAQVWVCCPLQLNSKRYGTMLVLGHDPETVHITFCHFVKDLAQTLTHLVELHMRLQDVETSNQLLSDILPYNVARKLKGRLLRTSRSRGNSFDKGNSFKTTNGPTTFGKSSCHKSLDENINHSSVDKANGCSAEHAVACEKTIGPSFEALSYHGLGDCSMTGTLRTRGNPAACAEEVVYKQWHSNVSILFADIVGYTSMSQDLDPGEVMSMLHTLFSKFDHMCSKWGVYKVETIGDCYMACTGLLQECNSHAHDLVMFAKDMISAAMCTDSPEGGNVRIRLGVHSGRVMSGVVGAIRPRYCLFGDSVNTASRMESTGVPDCIQVSASTYELLPGELQSQFTPRGPIQVKGKGEMWTYLVQPLDYLVR